jgi:uncharacterized repeat protein (TIGR03803 family)
MSTSTSLVRVALVAPALFACAIVTSFAAPVADAVVAPFRSISPNPEIPQHGVLLQAKDGNFYGLTQNGGTAGLGTAFQATPAGALTLLHSFTGTTDGFDPQWGLVQAKNGDLYGTTDNSPAGSGGHGTIFRLSTTGTFTTLHDFATADGGLPEATLVVGPDGLLYGTTLTYGANNGGTVFRIAPDGSKFAVVTQFDCIHAAGPCNPIAGLSLGADGAFYGITMAYSDAFHNNGYGAVYRVTTAGAVTLLHAFTQADGALNPPSGVPARDAAGNVFFYGDPRNSTMQPLIYRLDAAGNLSVFYAFSGLSYVCGFANQPLRLDRDGRIYGVIHCNDGPVGSGFAFSVAPDGTMHELHDFVDDGIDVTSPQIPYVRARDGALWSMTGSGAYAGGGGVYRLNRPTPTLAVRPKTITAGQHAKLAWTSTDTTDCTASGAWSGPQATAGSLIVAPAVAGTYAYTLTCAGAGTRSRTVKLTVN